MAQVPFPRVDADEPGAWLVVIHLSQDCVMDRMNSGWDFHWQVTALKEWLAPLVLPDLCCMAR